MDITGRKRIGILFIFKSRWLGGLYYLLNVIRAFEYLPEGEQPELVLFYNDRTKVYLDRINYPNIQLVKIDVDFTLSRFVKSILLNRNCFFVPEFLEHNLEALYPFNDFVGSIKNKHGIKLLSWIPDFQHKLYPGNFGKIGFILREFKFRNIVSKSDGLILSSEAAYKNLKDHYNPPAGFKTHIAKFTSIIDVDKLPDGNEILIKYGLSHPYFIVSNQFYKHKNHIVVLKALKLLKDQEKAAFVVFTGKPDQTQDEGLWKEMKLFIGENQLFNSVMMLGLLPREDQLSLMKNALAVIQPSKFEGWSTVVEDAKTVNTFVIASDLDVHTEQLGSKGLFFPPDNAGVLANCMAQVTENGFDTNMNWDSLSIRTQTFAKIFLASFN